MNLVKVLMNLPLSIDELGQSLREFVKYNLPEIPKGLNVNNRR